MKAEKLTSVAAYIAGFPPDIQILLERMRTTIKKAAPEAEEMISYNMPLYKLNGRMLVSFAGWKEHIGMYPSPTVAQAEFKKKLVPLSGSKATLKFPINKALPLTLIAQCVKFRIKEIEQKAKKKQ